MLSLSQVSPPKSHYPLPTPPLTNPPTPTSLPTPGHRTFTGTRASPPIDDQLGHPLLHMQLEPWVSPCVLFSWWFSPWELWGCWLVHIVVPSMALQNPSAPWVLSLVPPLRTLSSVHGWLGASTSVFVRHWYSPSGYCYISLLSTSTCWHQQ